MDDRKESGLAGLGVLKSAILALAIVPLAAPLAISAEKANRKLPLGVEIRNPVKGSTQLVVPGAIIDLRQQLESTSPENDNSNNVRPIDIPTGKELSRELNLKAVSAFEADIKTEQEQQKSKQRPQQLGKAAVNTILQMEKQITSLQKATLRNLGITVEGGGVGNTYSVSVDEGVDVSQALQNVGSTIIDGRLITTRDKLLSNIVNNYESFAQISASTKQVPLFVDVSRSVQTPAQRRSFKASLKAAGAHHIEDVTSQTLLIRADLEDITAIAELSDVLAIDGGPLPFLPLAVIPSAEKVFKAIKLDKKQAFLFTEAAKEPTAKYDGSGTRIAIFDDGIDEMNMDFRSFDNFSLRIAPNRVELQQHGTTVAAIAAGNGANSTKDPTLPKYGTRGVAFRATLGDHPSYGLSYLTDPDDVSSSDVDDFITTFRGQIENAIRSEKSDVSNHSYIETLREYSRFSAKVDTFIAGVDENLIPTSLVARPQVWAAGNNGTELAESSTLTYGKRKGYYSIFTQAKNSISVGSVDVEANQAEISNEYVPSAFSSRGPTFDGRIKPDLVAPGCIETDRSYILSPVLSYQNYKNVGCGTSYAAPVVSGVIALMSQAMRLAGRDVFNVRPSSYKALLIHGAVDLKQAVPPPHSPEREPLVYGEGPDFVTGFGMLNAETSISLAESPNQWLEASITPTARSKTWCFTVPADAKKLRLTTAWDDPPNDQLVPANFATPLLRHDIDITARPLNGDNASVALPWVVAAPPGLTDLNAIDAGDPDPIGVANVQLATKGDDDVNTVEVIDVKLPKTGRWEVKATIDPANTNGFTQVFSLVADFPLSNC